MPQLSKRPVHLELEPLESRCVLSTAAYVSSLYVDFLHRVPAASEVAGWVAAINNGESPSAVAAAFTSSPEYLGDTVQATYQLYLNRQPTPAETAGWVAALQNGLPETQLQAAFLASDEFFAQHGGSNLPWLNAVYQKALGRDGAPSELAAWNQVLQSGVPRQSVALDIVTSPEADARLVSAAYQALLGHAPDPAGLAMWVSQLQHGMTPSQLLAAIAGSSEFITREGGLDAVTPPPNRRGPVDTFGEPFLPPLPVFPIGGYTYTPIGFTGGFTSGCGCTGGFTGGSGGFTGGFSGGGSGGSGF